MTVKFTSVSYVIQQETKHKTTRTKDSHKKNMDDEWKIS